MHTRITLLPNPKRKSATDLIVRLPNGMIVACNSWTTAMRLLEDDLPVIVRTAEMLVPPFVRIRQPEKESY